jgi:hypothetical protein
MNVGQWLRVSDEEDVGDADARQGIESGVRNRSISIALGGQNLGVAARVNPSIDVRG